MGTKTYSSFTDLVTFSRASTGTSLRPISYGPELVTNGTFDTDVSGWTELNSGANITASWDAGRLSQTSIATSQGTYATITTETGKVYMATADLVSATANVLLRVGDGSAPDAGIASTADTTTPGTLSLVFVAQSTTSYVYLRQSAIGTSVWDNVSVREVLFDQPDGTLTLFNHPAGIPRLNYTAAGVCRGILMEGARENLVTHSEDFTNASWVKVRASLSNGFGETSPLGNDSYKLLGTTDNNTHFVYFNLTGSGDRVISVFAKAAELSWLVLANTGFGTLNSSYDLSSGSVGTVTGFSSANMEDHGNGWYRCSAVIPSATADGSFDFVIGLGSADNTFVFGGATDEGIYIDGAQFEAGAFPSSYIPTSGSTVTRAADVCYTPVADIPFNADAGTFVVSCQTYDAGGTVASKILEASGTGELLYTLSSGNTSVFSSDGTNVLTVLNLLNDTDVHKVAVTQDNAGGKPFADGVAGSLNASYDIMSVLPGQNIGIGGNSGDGIQPIYGHIRYVAYYPRRLTDDQIVELTL